ncbi:MAG: PEP-CTERM sorting domain-containing protein [Planctomycetota bacterium]
MLKLTALATASLFVTGTTAADIVFTVTDIVPGGGPANANSMNFSPGDTGSGPANLSSTLGSVSAPAPVGLTTGLTYTVTGLDLTSVGGTASETIVFDLNFSQTGGVTGDGTTDIQVNGFGNIAVIGSGANDNWVDGDETLTSTVVLDAGSTTFGGTVEVGIIMLSAGNFGSSQPAERYDAIHDGGTELGVPVTNNPVSFDPSSFVTLDPTVGGMNLERIDFQITAVPEPGSLALLGLGGLLIARRRRE